MSALASKTNIGLIVQALSQRNWGVLEIPSADQAAMPVLSHTVTWIDEDIEGSKMNHLSSRLLDLTKFPPNILKQL